MGTAAEEKNLQICNGEEEQEVSNVEDPSGLRTLSSSSLYLLVWRRMKGAGGNLEEGVVAEVWGFLTQMKPQGSGKSMDCLEL